MNQAENAKNSTLGFSNRHRALKFATGKTIVKQDGAQFRNIIAVMMVKIYKHLTKLSTNMTNFRKIASHEQKPKHDQNESK